MMKNTGHFNLPILGRNTLKGHIATLFKLALVGLFGYLIFFVLSFYIGLGVDVVQGLGHTLNK